MKEKNMAKTDSASESWRGKVGALEHEEFAAFMSEPHIARLACLDEEG
jgi:hypothetical protein